MQPSAALGGEASTVCVQHKDGYLAPTRLEAIVRRPVVQIVPRAIEFAIRISVGSSILWIIAVLAACCYDIRNDSYEWLGHIEQVPGMH